MFDKYMNGKQINFQFIAISPISSYGKECEGDFFTAKHRNIAACQLQNIGNSRQFQSTLKLAQ